MFTGDNQYNLFQCLLKIFLLWMQIDKLVDQAAGFIVDLGNTKAVRKALYETLQIPVPNSRTTRTGKPRTDAEVGNLQILMISEQTWHFHLMPST